MSAAGGQDDQGLSAKSPRAAACSIEAFAWTYSSMVLRSMLGVASLVDPALSRAKLDGELAQWAEHADRYRAPAGCWSAETT
jgi:hypothetical protein